ncbi:MAG: LuxR C-terminal-related transcriptional regulator [Verrucomicrobiota bacterium]|jgi:DNA-binding NarL/FixJ family response regulator
MIGQTNSKLNVTGWQNQADASLACRAAAPFADKQVDKNSPFVTGDIVSKVVQSFQLSAADRLYPGVLSKREWEVLVMLARGFKYKEIAYSSDIKVCTVNTYIRRIYKKLHVSSRARAVVLYLQSICPTNAAPPMP